MHVVGLGPHGDDRHALGVRTAGRDRARSAPLGDDEAELRGDFRHADEIVAPGIT